MSRIEKEIEKLKLKSNNYTYDEAKRLLTKLGFYENNKGMTSGSRDSFVNTDNIKIFLHKPHPNKILKTYQIKEIIRALEEGGIIQ